VDDNFNVKLIDF